MRYRSTIGFDLDGSDLYAAELLLTKRGPVLQAIGHLVLPAEIQITPDLLAGYLRDMGREGPFTAKTAAMAVPRTGASHRLLDLPPLGLLQTRLATAAALEEQVAFPSAELCLGYQRMGKGRAVRAVAARRSLVEERRAAIVAAGLIPARIDLRCAAAATAFWYGYGAALGDRTAVLVELRSLESTAIFLRQGEILYSRTLPGLGRDGLLELQEFAAELRGTFALLRAWPDWVDPDYLWLAGPRASSPDVREALADQLGLDPSECRVVKLPGLLRPATIRDPLTDLLGMAPADVEVSDPHQSFHAESDPGPAALVPIGLCLAALAVEALGPDLLPGLEPAEAGRRPLQTLAVPLGLSLVLALAGVRLLVGAAAKQSASNQAWLAANRERVATLTALNEESAASATRLRELQRFGGGSAAYLEFLLALDDALPAGTRLTRFSVSGRRVELVEGITPSVSILMRRLKSDPVLARLNLRGQAVSKTENGQTVDAFALAGPFGQEGQGNETEP